MNADNNTEKRVDVYQLVTNRIIELLEQGAVPWRKPWSTGGMPQNLISKRPYRGINLMLLNAMSFEHPQFLTFKQLKTIGASVNKGEKGQFVVFTKMEEKDIVKDGVPSKEKCYILRYYKVFNVDQCKDIPKAFMPTEEENANKEIPNCKTVVEQMPHAPKIVHKKAEAYYVPSEDYVNMPKLKSFSTSEEYYGTLFHELIHSTGHKSRCYRTEVTENPKFGTEPYSLEELVAEIGSCYLKSYTGLSIEDMSNNVAYIDGWLSVLKGDKRFILKASSRSQQAVEYILNTKKGIKESTEEHEHDVVETF